MPQLLIATGNVHKIDEIRGILDIERPGHGLNLRFARDFPDVPEPLETGGDFETNALIKARVWAGATGLPALADDSGLVVDALDGRPGIYSARYADSAAERIARVLRELDGVPAPRRTARFECVMALRLPDGHELTRRGTVEGRITDAPRGAGGFGYDPVFELVEPDLEGLTMAELNSAGKHAVSHRGRALRALLPELFRLP